jgi:hypothetical protein
MKLRMIGIVVCVGALAGCSSEKKPSPVPPATVPPPRASAPSAPVSGTVGEQTVTANATVQKVDMKTRHVTLKDSDGKTLTIVAGPEVRNLAQVKKGDVVRITYKESMAYQVNKPGMAQPGAGVATDVSRAPLGAKPGGTVANTVTVRVTIAAIDKAAPSVTLRDSEGNLSTVKVRDPSKLDQVQVGDVVDITYTEALAVAVESPKK